jgi:transposase InsO family protein
MIGCTPYPDEAFVRQSLRQVTGEMGLLREGRVLLCDRDPKWSSAVETFLNHEGVRIIRTPAQAPNCNAYAERFVRSIKKKCLDGLGLLGEHHLRRALAEFDAHYHAERNHQGLGNELIEPLGRSKIMGTVRRRQRLGGMLNYYYRAA